MSIEWLLIKNRGINKQKSKPDEESPSVETQKSPNELKLHCDCGFEGIFSMSKADFEFLGEDKKGYAYFQCTNCTRHLRYDISTGRVKTSKDPFRGLSTNTRPI
jgi:hypothetical protein